MVMKKFSTFCCPKSFHVRPKSSKLKRGGHSWSIRERDEGKISWFVWLARFRKPGSHQQAPGNKQLRRWSPALLVSRCRARLSHYMTKEERKWPNNFGSG